MTQQLPVMGLKPICTNEVAAFEMIYPITDSKKKLSDTKIAVKNGQGEQVLSVWPTELVDQIDIGSFRAVFK